MIDAYVKTLGILPYAAEQCVICVEGENDVNFLTNINKIPEFSNIISLENEHIRIIPLQGSNLLRWVNSNYFAESNIKEIHFYDNDREDYRRLIADIKATNDKRRYGWLTERREMENYIPPHLIEEEFAVDLTHIKSIWESADIPQILIGMAFNSVADVKKRESIVKSILNGKLSKKITADMLKEMNAFEELEIFFKKVKAVYDGTFMMKFFTET